MFFRAKTISAAYNFDKSWSNFSTETWAWLQLTLLEDQVGEWAVLAMFEDKVEIVLVSACGDEFDAEWWAFELV